MLNHNHNFMLQIHGSIYDEYLFLCPSSPNSIESWENTRHIQIYKFGIELKKYSLNPQNKDGFIRGRQETLTQIKWWVRIDTQDCPLNSTHVAWHKKKNIHTFKS